MDAEPSAIGIGIGMGTHSESVKALETFLKKNKAPLVIDADALNMISKSKARQQLLPKQAVLTPHPKELERLIGAWEDDFDKLSKAKAFAKTHDCILVLKGAHTITIYNERLFVNSTGNPGMATAGMGDVLSGIITSFVAQGYDPLQAAIFGVYLHGSAADIALNSLGYQSMIATDIVEHLGKAFLELFKRNEPQQTQKQ